MNTNLELNSFRPLVDAINRLEIPAHAISGIFGLVDGYTGTLTVDVVYQAWQAYKQSPAFKSVAGSRVAS